MTAPLLIDALNRKMTPRPPVWLMRQAGRYLPEYQIVRIKHPDFIKFCLNPEAAAMVTLQPVSRFNLDAAIIFADILTIPDALGHKVTFTPSHGPSVEKLTNPSQITALRQSLSALAKKLAPVGETVMHTRAALPAEKAVIGFSGAPWTLACYMLDERPSQRLEEIIAFAKKHPEAFKELIAVLTDAAVAYLNMQLLAGAEAVQVFDSWASACPPELWDVAVHWPMINIVKALRMTSAAPIILFPRAAPTEGLEALAQVLSGQGVALSLSQEVDMAWACERLQPHVAIQGNLDPQLFTLKDPEPLRQAAMRLIELGQRQPGFVLNTGHGLTPATRIERVAELATLVRSWA